MIKLHIRFVFRVIEYTLLVAFDGNLKPIVDELLGSGWGEGSTLFELLLFAAQPETGGGHFLVVQR